VHEFIREACHIHSIAQVHNEMREELPFPEKVLQTLHNLCATAADLARRGDEVARILQRDPAEIERILDTYKSEGFAESFYDNEGKKRYYLNGRGIIKVCSLFT
jgi:HD superfamily phosphodiesterase